MIKTIARHTPFFRALIIFSFLFLFRIHTFVEKARVYKGHKYALNSEAFLLAILMCLSVSAIFFFYLKAKTKKFWIDNNQIKIKFYLRKEMRVLLNEINSISWQSNGKEVTNFSPMSKTVSARNDSITITFKNEFVLNFNINEYSNFNELRVWFFNYGTERGIIKAKMRKDIK